MTYIFSQIFAVMAYIFFALSFFTKNKRNILFFNLGSTVCFLIQYIFLNGMGGVLVNCVGIVRCILFYIDDKKQLKNNIWSLVICLVLFSACSAGAITSWLEIIPVVSAFIFTFALWQKKVLVYRWIAVVCSVLWITYNIVHASLFGIVGEGIVFVVEVASVIRIYIENKKRSSTNEPLKQDAQLERVATNMQDEPNKEEN